MNDQHDRSRPPSHGALAEEHRRLLVDYDAGKPSDPAAGQALSPEQQERLAAQRACLDLMHEAWPSEPADDASPVAETPHFDAPQTLGDFRLGDEIGRGGMGVVYEAEQLSLNRRVALKVLPFTAMLDEKAITRFKNEARAAATLEHPNIVPVFAVGNERGVYYYAMAYIDGRTLAEVVAALRQTQGCGVTEPYTNAATQLPASSNTPSDGRAPSEADTKADTQAALSTLPDYGSRDHTTAVVRLGIQAARALHHAHERGIVHRDVKPGNLMLDANAKLWVTDFGLARIESEAGVTMTGDLLGTLRYMAPEQAGAGGAIVDHRVDLYALGITLYELLALRPAFTARDRGRLLRQIEQDDPPPLHKFNAAVSDDLETILTKATAKEPRERYATAADLADDLERLLEHRPILAKPPTPLARLGKWSRRHVAVVWALVAVMGVLGAALATSRHYTAVAFEKEALARGEALDQKQAAEKATLEAKEAAERAKRKAQESDAVLGFLLDDVLGQFDSALDLARRPTLADSLDSAGEKLETRFGDQPEVEASLRLAIAKLHLLDRRADQAEIHARRALELYSGLAGISDERSREALEILASVAVVRGVASDHIDQLQRLSSIYQEHYPNTDRGFQLLVDLGCRFAGVGYQAKAQQYLDEAEKQLASQPPNDNRELLITGLRAAVAFKDYKHDLAIDHYRQGEQIGADGSVEPVLLYNHRMSYAGDLLRMGRADDCIEVLQLMRGSEEDGRPHENNGGVAVRTALLHRLLQAGDYREAIAVGEELVSILDARNAYLESVEAYRHLGACHAAVGNDAASIDCLKRARQLAQSAPSSQRQKCILIDAMSDLAWALSQTPGHSRNRYELALELVKDLEEIQSLNPALCLTRGAARFGIGRFGEAIEDLRRSLAGRYGEVNVSASNMGDLSQSGISPRGSIGLAWRRVQIESLPDTDTPGAGWVIWRLDGREVARQPFGANGIDPPRGSVTLGYMDMFPNVCGAPRLTFGIADNLRVHSPEGGVYDDFESDSAHRYRVSCSSEDTEVLFGYDYSSIGIPPAPRSNNAGTRGLRFGANLSPPTGAEAVTLHTARSFAGHVTVEFDAWLNYGVDGDFVTEFLTCGVGGDAISCNLASATDPSGSGYWFAVDGNAGAAIDFRSYAGRRDYRSIGGVHGSNQLWDNHPYLVGRGSRSNEYYFLAMCHAALQEFEAAEQNLQLARADQEQEPTTKALGEYAEQFVRDARAQQAAGDAGPGSAGVIGAK